MSRQVVLGNIITAVGKAGTGPTVVLVDGVVSPLTVTSSLVTGSTDLFVYSTTPDQTGVFTLIGDGNVVGEFEVVARDFHSYLQNLEDQALGTWEWDKTTKVMTLYRQDGTVLKTFLADDGIESAYLRAN